MPEGTYLKDLFIKHFVAKSFGWTPDVLDRVAADEFDALVFIESELNRKEKEEMEKIKRRNKT